MALAKGARGPQKPSPAEIRRRKGSRPPSAPSSPPAFSGPSRGTSERPGSSSQVSNPSSLRSYPFLRVNSGVDWRGVQPTLLQRLNWIGKKLGRVVTLTSGARTHAEQRYLYNQYLAGNIGLAAKPGTSNHEHAPGEYATAVDALIEGQAIGDVIPENGLNQLGLHSLAAAGDAVHVELVEGTGGTTPPQGGAPPQASMTASQEVPVSAAAPPPAQGAQAGTPPPQQFEGVMSPQPILPYELGSEAPVLTPVQRAETWQLIAGLPGASPETQQLARFASMSVEG